MTLAKQKALFPAVRFEEAHPTVLRAGILRLTAAGALGRQNLIGYEILIFRGVRAVEHT